MPHRNAVSRTQSADERLAKSNTTWHNDAGVVRRPPMKESVNMFLAFH